jgi:predicted DNA binding CopG/RHH family protein
MQQKGGNMPQKSSKGGRFRSEAEEADWHATPEGRRQTAREFAHALKAGTLSRSAGLRIPKTDPKLLEELMHQAKEHASRPISIRLPIADLERAKRIAKRTGIGYQTVLKRAIRKGLTKAG